MRSRVVVLAAIVCVLSLGLALPAAAGAHVRGKYKTEYKRELAKMQALFDTSARTFTATQASIDATATAMRGMLGDPAQAEALRALEQSAGSASQRMTDETMPDAWMAVETVFSSYLGNASRWFVSLRDRVRFTGAASTMKQTFSLLVQDAAEAQSLEYQALGQDPPDLDGQRAHAGTASGRAAKAKAGLRRDVAALKTLL
jgi:hypothetical protein